MPPRRRHRASRTTPTGRSSTATGPTTTSACECGNLLAEAMDADVHDEARCACAAARCRTINVAVTDESEPTPRALSGAAEREQRGAVPGVGGGAVAVDGGDAHERRMPHRGRREVEQRVVVGALPLHAAEAEALGGQAARRAASLGRRRARGRARGTRRASKPSGALGGVEVEREQAGRREVLGPVDLDQRAASARARGRPAAAGSRARRAAPRRRPCSRA